MRSNDKPFIEIRELRYWFTRNQGLLAQGHCRMMSSVKRLEVSQHL
jgi:hypothetical protein